MLRSRPFSLAFCVTIQLSLCGGITKLSFAQEWEVQSQRGIIKVVDVRQTAVSAMRNYTEGRMTVDKDNRWIPCLADDWRWIDACTIEFMLRQGVTFHNYSNIFNVYPE